MSVDEEQALYSHYGRGYDTSTADDTDITDTAETGGAGGTVTELGRDKVISNDTSGRAASTVRSEEELSVGKTSRGAGRVRLRKWVETDDVHLTVPAERQMARVVREPVSEGDRTGVSEFVAGEEEIVFSEETVDVSRRVFAKERVGVERDTVTEQVPWTRPSAKNASRLKATTP